MYSLSVDDLSNFIEHFQLQLFSSTDCSASQGCVRRSVVVMRVFGSILIILDRSAIHSEKSKSYVKYKVLILSSRPTINFETKICYDFK